jgi:hypothetical protein
VLWPSWLTVRPALGFGDSIWSTLRRTVEAGKINRDAAQGNRVNE